MTVFGSGHLAEGHSHYDLARETGTRLADAGFTVMTGGGSGLMEAANRGAREAGGVSVACSISLPVEERPNPYVDQVVKFDHFFIRKEILIKSSFGFVAFPGGLGTFDEVFEAATLIHTGKIQSFPIVLLGRDFWDPLISFLTAQTHEGAMADCTTSHFYVADSPTDAVDHIRNGSMWQKHVRPEAEFIEDARAGKLPAVSWLITGVLSEHPPMSTCLGENWTVDQIKKIRNFDLAGKRVQGTHSRENALGKLI